MKANLHCSLLMFKNRSTNLCHCLSTRVEATLSRLATVCLKNATQFLSNTLSIQLMLRYHANFKFVRSGMTIALSKLFLFS